MASNGCVIFAKNVNEMSQFYQSVLNLALSAADDSHHVLSNNDLELVVHAIPKEIAQNIQIESPPTLRSNTAMKPVYSVESLEAVRYACDNSNGGLKPATDAFEIRGATVLDGWDPEGNVIQFKQATL